MSRFLHHLRRFIAGFLCLLPIATALPVWAGSPYEAVAPLDGADESAAARTAAMRVALQAVLVRVSGRADVADQPAMAEAMRDPLPLVQQYRQYDDDGDGVPDLWVAFDPKAVTRLLQKTGTLPATGATERPATLVWIALEQGGETMLAGDDTGHDWVGPLRAAAERRGLPLILPLYDLEDQAQLPAVAIVKGDGKRVQTSSSRYKPRAVLTVHLKQDPAGQWQGAWRLLYQGQVSAWSTAPGSLDAALAAGVEGAADRLFGQVQTPSGRPEADVMLRVTGVTGLAGFAAIEGLLRDIPIVTSVQTSRIETDTVDYLLKAHGGAAALQQALILQPALQPESPPAQAVADGVLRYRYQP